MNTLPKLNEVRVIDADAPRVPFGFQVRPGVEFGCGEATCERCYEPKNHRVIMRRRIEREGDQ